MMSYGEAPRADATPARWTVAVRVGMRPPPSHIFRCAAASHRCPTACGRPKGGNPHPRVRYPRISGRVV